MPLIKNKIFANQADNNGGKPIEKPNVCPNFVNIKYTKEITKAAPIWTANPPLLFTLAKGTPNRITTKFAKGKANTP